MGDRKGIWPAKTSNPKPLDMVVNISGCGTAHILDNVLPILVARKLCPNWKTRKKSLRNRKFDRFCTN